MFWESRRDQWLLIGTQVGMGYDCLMDKIDLFDDSDNGMWNKISDHVNFIHKVVRDYGEKICKNREEVKILERIPRRKLVGGG